ncbi:hypothetical protein EQG49_12735 [Periweissella cryptocerci]|uniref:ArpU family transcriptional regulator n=1 Tax=Periweissella cryptocerci TaxID=2506420 RepID=A0A4P6YWQ2_9LACO|nr:ArpU family phage packaging/lysis transcriptional regulator [Periweissella cryptocerci]QBO37264.1 hypothetical protein EQG49_12735 [Periweissella cryptocerci]
MEVFVPKEIELFDSLLDYDATAKKVKYFFKQPRNKVPKFERLYTQAGISDADLKSPTLSADKVQASADQNSAEQKMMTIMMAKEKLAAILAVIEGMETVKGRIMKLYYIQGYSDRQVMSAVGYGESRYRDFKTTAAVVFAESLAARNVGINLTRYVVNDEKIPENEEKSTKTD